MKGIFTITVCFLVVFSTAKNICEQCVDKENIFLFKRNFMYECVKPSDMKSQTYLLSYKSVQQCENAAKIISKKGNSTGIHRFFLPPLLIPSRTQLNAKTKMIISTRAPSILTSTLTPGFTRFATFAPNSTTFSTLTGFPAPSITVSRPTFTRAPTLASIHTSSSSTTSRPLALTSSPAPSSTTSTTTSTPITTNITSTSSISTKKVHPSLSVEKIQPSMKNEKSLGKLDFVSSMNSTKFRTKKDRFNSSSSSFMYDAYKCFYKYELLAKSDEKWDFLRKWNWLSPVLNGFFSTFGFNKEKILQREMKKIKEMDEDEVLKVAANIFCQGYKYAMEIFKADSSIWNWIFNHPGHLGNEFQCLAMQKFQFDLMQFLIK